MKRPNKEEQRELVRQMQITYRILDEMKAAERQGLPFELKQSATYLEEQAKKRAQDTDPCGARSATIQQPEVKPNMPGQKVEESNE